MKDKLKSDWLDKSTSLVYEFDEPDKNEDSSHTSRLFVHVYKQERQTRTHVFCGGNVEIGKKGFSFKTYGLQRKPTKIYIYWQDLTEL